MRYRSVWLLLFILIQFTASAQGTAYTDSMKRYIDKYIKEHEVVKGEDKKMLQFFPVNEKYMIKCTFQLKPDSPWFKMNTSVKFIKPLYRIYGTASFKINDTTLTLNIYQSKDLMITEEYKDHLFIPFTDLTSGAESYGGGRYIDIKTADIKKNTIVIDFNKAYNPYCAYKAGYSCPIPPKENDLPVAIKAGEMNYKKHH